MYLTKSYQLFTCKTSKTDVKSYYDSDHSPIYAEIQYKSNQQSPGPGFWKFNNYSLFDNEEFVTHLKFFLTHAKEKHHDTKDIRLYWEDFIVFVFPSGLPNQRGKEK